MVENNPSDVKLDENPDGTVSFATDVVATIAGLAATEVEGVASMSSPSSALADMFSRKNTRNFTKVSGFVTTNPVSTRSASVCVCVSVFPSVAASCPQPVIDNIVISQMHATAFIRYLLFMLLSPLRYLSVYPIL